MVREAQAATAAAAADPQISTAAALNLALLLMQRGEFPEAERLLRQVETTHPPYTDRVRFNLAGVLAMQARNQEAEAIFSQVIEAGDPEEAPGAMTQLAALYFRTGRFDESERLYRQALAAGHPEFTALAAAGLDDIERRRGS